MAATMWGEANQRGFKIGAPSAFKEAARKASPVKLESVMSVEVVTRTFRGRHHGRPELASRMD
jgi:hypothetical protein